MSEHIFPTQQEKSLLEEGLAMVQQAREEVGQAAATLEQAKQAASGAAHQFEAIARTILKLKGADPAKYILGQIEGTTVFLSNQPDADPPPPAADEPVVNPADEKVLN